MNSTPLFAIGIPTINRKDLLLEALEVYRIKYPNTTIFIMDNGQQDIVATHHCHHVQTNETNYGVAKSWNHLCSQIFAAGFRYALILNDDIVLGSTESELNDYLQQHIPEYDFVGSTLGFCSFILPQKTFNAIGKFDEAFGNAYYEDDDYLYRLRLANVKVAFTPILAPEVFRNSQTIAKDPELNKSFEDNKAYYIQKWGGLPRDETYLTPFNK